MSSLMLEVARSLLGAAFGLFFAGSFLLAGRAMMTRLIRERSLTRRWLGEAVVALWLASLAGIALLGLGSMTRIALLGTAGTVLAGAVHALGGPAAVRRTVQADLRFGRRLAARVARRPWSAWITGALLLLAVPVLLRPLLAPPLGWDTQTYHGLKAGAWAHAGRWVDFVGPGPWAVHGPRAGGYSLLAAIGMALLGNDLGMSAMEGAYWALLGLSIVVAGRAVRIKEPWGSAGALFLLSIPTVRLLPGSGYSEPFLLAMLSAAVGFARDARPRHGRVPAALVLTGASLGLAAAAKPNALPLGPAILGLCAVACFWPPPRPAGRAKVLASVGLAIAAFIAVIAPWLLRTWSQTGHPLSPLPLRLGPVVLGEANPETLWYNERPGYRHLDPPAELAGLVRVFGSPLTRNESPTVLSLVALLVCLLRARRWLAAPWPWPAALAVGGACLLWYYHPLFAVVRQTEWAITGSRFLIPALGVGVLGSLLGRPSPRGVHPWLVFLVASTAFLLVSFSFHGCGPSETQALVGLWALTGCLLALGVVLRRHPGARRAVSVAGAALLVCLVLALRPALRWDVATGGFVVCPFPRYWVGAARAVDGDHPVRIAVTSGPNQNLDNWFTSLFLGRDLQNEVVYVPTSHDGEVVHWSAGSLRREAERADPSAWRARLLSRRVDAVMSFEPTSIELLWMESRPDLFRRIDGIRSRWGLFAVLRPPA